MRQTVCERETDRQTLCVCERGGERENEREKEKEREREMRS